MPGHSKFFTNTFGFTMDSPEGQKVLGTCLNEFFKEIPTDLCPYFHIGSDEVSIPDPKGFVKSHNRKILSWDPGLSTSTENIRQVWNPGSVANKGGVTKSGSFVDSSMGYLNYYDPIVFTNRVFLHTPCSRDGQGDSIALGGILCLWNDVRSDIKENIARHSGMSNGMLTYAARFWEGGRVANIPNLNVLPDPESETGKRLQAFERKLIYHRDNVIPTIPMRWVANSHIPWNIEIAGRTIKAWGGAIEMDALCEQYEIQSEPKAPVTAKTEIYVNCDTTITAWIGFDVPARSNRLSAGIAPVGEWESGGAVLINGDTITPPLRNEPGKYRHLTSTWHKPAEEQPYTDEQFYYTRPAISIPLKKGWNTISLYCPKDFKWQRWSFAFIPLTVEGNRVKKATGITYR